MPIPISTLLKRINAENLARFKLMSEVPIERKEEKKESKEKEEKKRETETENKSITYIAQMPSRFSDFHSKPLVLTKQFFRLPNTFSGIDFIQKAEKTTGFVWHTNYDKISKGVAWGVLKPQSLTGQAIYHLGKYHIQVARRAVHHRYVSDRYSEKNTLLCEYQALIKQLQRLELAVNHGEIDKKEVLRLLEAYKEELTHKLKTLNLLNRGLANTLCTHINSLLQYAQDYRMQIACAADASTITQARGENALAEFVRRQTRVILKQAQYSNQNISYDGARLTRGDFNSFCEDALEAVNTYVYDAHNPMLSSHHLDFEYQPDREQRRLKTIAVDSEAFEIDVEAMPDVLLAISFIEGQYHISQERRGDCTLINYEASRKEKIKLSKTCLTKWAAVDSRTPLKCAVWMLNMLTGTVMGILVDFPLGFICGFFNLFYPIASPISRAKKLKITLEDPYVSKTSTYYQLCQKIKSPEISFGTRFSYLLFNAIKHTFIDLFTGVSTFVVNFPHSFYYRLKQDAFEGWWSQPEAKFDFAALLKEIKDIETQTLKLTKTVITRGKAEAKKPNINKESIFVGVEEKTDRPRLRSDIFAEPEYALTTFQFNDVCTVSPKAVDRFLHVFLHNIHTKHPATGLAFTAMGMVSMLAALLKNPAIFGKEYLAFNKWLGDIFTKETSAAIISSASTQSELLAVAIDAALQGSDSLLVQFCQRLEKDPAEATFYLSGAVGMGSFFTYCTPFFSPKELGDFPPAALAFVGFKLSILCVKLVSPKEAHDPQRILEADEQLLKTLSENYATVQGKQFLDEAMKIHGVDVVDRLDHIAYFDVVPVIAAEPVASASPPVVGLSSKVLAGFQQMVALLPGGSTEVAPVSPEGKASSHMLNLSKKISFEVYEREGHYYLAKKGPLTVSETIREFCESDDDCKKMLIALEQLMRGGLKQQSKKELLASLEPILAKKCQFQKCKVDFEIPKKSTNATIKNGKPLFSFYEKEKKERETKGNDTERFSWYVKGTDFYGRQKELKIENDAMKQRLRKVVNASLAREDKDEAKRELLQFALKEFGYVGLTQEDHDYIEKVRQNLSSENEFYVFLMILLNHREKLALLSEAQKYKLTRWIESQNNIPPDIARSIREWIYPTELTSIMEETARTALDYIPAIIRCLISPFTGSFKKPFYTLCFKIEKDLMRLAETIFGFLKIPFQFVDRVVIKSICDVVVNEIFARVEGFFSKKSHWVSDCAHEVSCDYDTSSAQMLSALGGRRIQAYKDTQIEKHPASALKFLLRSSFKPADQPEVVPSSVELSPQ